MGDPVKHTRARCTRARRSCSSMRRGNDPVTMASGREQGVAWRHWGLPVVLSGATLGFAIWLNRFYPLHQWLVWRFAGYWLLSGVWLAACWSLGFVIVKRLIAHGMRASERLTLSLAVGVLGFVYLVFVVGLLGGLGWLTFFALPAVCLAVGGRPLWRHLSSALRHAKHSGWLTPPRGLALAVWLYGIGGLLILYFQILSPEPFSFDTRWYHIPLGQRYAVTGSVSRFDEGWWFGGYPHLASYLYAWAYLLPLGKLFDRLELCAHLEFALFEQVLAFAIANPSSKRETLPVTA